MTDWYRREQTAYRARLNNRRLARMEQEQAAKRLSAMYVFRCLVCGQEWPSDGHTQPCPKCLREGRNGWSKQEIVGFPK